MFGHIFITRFKCLIRSKEIIFWSLIFPLILATLFKVAFGNLSGNEIFKAIDIAVIKSEHYEKNQGFKTAIELVSEEGENKLFNLTFPDEKQAEELLKYNKISGYIFLNPEIQLVVKGSGMKQTIVKTFLDDYKQSEKTITAVMKANPRADIIGLIMDISSHKQYTREVSPAKGKPDTILNYFYTLIAMACMYGGFLGLKEVTDIQGDLSKRAARINMAPVHKLKVFVYGLLAALSIHFMQMLVLIAYLRFALSVDFGNQLPYILLLCFAGSASGVSLGAMVSALIKKSEGVKVAILIMLSIATSTLAGMYYANIKYIIQKNVPVLAYINPAALITDGFYTLYYYNSYGRYFINTSILAGLSVVFCLITYLIIRRQKYASI